MWNVISNKVTAYRKLYYDVINNAFSHEPDTQPQSAESSFAQSVNSTFLKIKP